MSDEIWRDPMSQPVTEEMLAVDPAADDFAEELAARAPRRLTRTTAALGGLVLVVAGFLGGVLVEKNYGTTDSATGRNNFPAAFPSAFANGQGGGAGGRGGAGGGGNATTGTIKLVDGTTIYITTANGDTVTVKTSGNTAVTTPAAVSDLKAGATVTVQGTADADGIITATRVTASK
jgi:hypothetical protein